MRMLTSGVVLLHDNACPHLAAGTWALLEHFNWKLFDYPPWSIDLTSSGYHLFTYLMNSLRPQCSNNNEELLKCVKMWMNSQAAHFSDTGTQKLIPHYEVLQFQ
jgi:hypothetical protein